MNTNILRGCYVLGIMLLIFSSLTLIVHFNDNHNPNANPAPISDTGLANIVNFLLAVLAVAMIYWSRIKNHYRVDLNTERVNFFGIWLVSGMFFIVALFLGLISNFAIVPFFISVVVLGFLLVNKARLEFRQERH